MTPFQLFTLCFFFLLSFCTFLKGFFPLKTTVTGFAKRDDYLFDPRNITTLGQQKLYDFVLPTSNPHGVAQMQQVRHRVENGETLALIGTANAPTVTMPRVKALVSGTIPSYVDMLFNFQSKAILEDNIIWQLSQIGNVNFYGDDTWLKLFPNTFHRSEGTTSFFVADYTEVDENVTRHIKPELHREDWNGLFLHYLGLDHIGHLAGPRSPLVFHKLREMDEIIVSVQTELNKKDGKDGKRSLLVVVGDHGMTEEGSHGGNSKLETHAAMLFVNHPADPQQSEEERKVAQIDLCPTLAVLFDLPISTTSLGVVIPSALATLDMRSRLRAMYQNAQQLSRLAMMSTVNAELRSNLLNVEDAVIQHISWLNLNEGDMESGLKLVALYRQRLLKLRDHLASSMTGYDLTLLVTGLLNVYTILVCLLASYFSFLSFIGMVLLLFILLSSSTFTLYLVVLCCTCSMLTNLRLALSRSLIDTFNFSGVARFPSAIVLVYGVSLLSSSFVEEEHQTWYFFVSGFWFVCICARSKPIEGQNILSSLLGLALCRILRSWNQTGDKWAHLPDLGDALREESNSTILATLCFCSLCVVAYILSKRKSVFERLLLVGFILLLYIYRCAELLQLAKPLEKVRIAQLAFLINALLGLKYVYGRKFSGCRYSASTVVFLIWCLLLRAHNIPLAALVLVVSQLVRREWRTKHAEQRAFIALIFSHATFFYQGNSNSISSIDVSSGYVGLSHYQPVAIGMLMFLHTYGGYIYWILLLYEDEPVKRNAYVISRVLVLSVIFPSTIYLSFAFTQRYHIFVWTVFSPKLLYQGTFVLLTTLLTSFSYSCR